MKQHQEPAISAVLWWYNIWYRYCLLISTTLKQNKMTNKGKGIAALIGLGISALAVFGYKRLPQEKKDEIKSKLNDAGAKLKETAEGIEESVTDTFHNVKDKFNETTEDVVAKAKTTKAKLEKELKDATA